MPCFDPTLIDEVKGIPAQGMDTTQQGGVTSSSSDPSARRSRYEEVADGVGPLAIPWPVDAHEGKLNQ